MCYEYFFARNFEPAFHRKSVKVIFAWFWQLFFSKFVSYALLTFIFDFPLDDLDVVITQNAYDIFFTYQLDNFIGARTETNWISGVN